MKRRIAMKKIGMTALGVGAALLLVLGLFLGFSYAVVGVTFDTDWFFSKEMIDRTVGAMAQVLPESKKYGFVQLGAAHYYNGIWGKLYERYLIETSNSVIADSRASSEWRPTWELFRVFWKYAGPETIRSAYNVIEPRLIGSLERHALLGKSIQAVQQFELHLSDRRSHGETKTGERYFSHLLIERRMKEVANDKRKEQLLAEMVESFIRAAKARMKQSLVAPGAVYRNFEQIRASFENRTPLEGEDAPPEKGTPEEKFLWEVCRKHLRFGFMRYAFYLVDERGVPWESLGVSISRETAQKQFHVFGIQLGKAYVKTMGVHPRFRGIGCSEGLTVLDPGEVYVQIQDVLEEIHIPLERLGSNKKALRQLLLEDIRRHVVYFRQEIKNGDDIYRYSFIGVVSIAERYHFSPQQIGVTPADAKILQ